jgi:hypothetical protein
MAHRRLSTAASSTELLSVALERTEHCNLHSGIFYRAANGALFKLHFAFHKDIRNEVVAENPHRTICVLMELDDRNFSDRPLEDFLAGLCEKIGDHSKNKTIGYNLELDESVVFSGETGEITCGPDSTGLGCSTFVLAVFRSGRVNLVSPVGWKPPTEEEVEWRKVLVSMIASRDPMHAAKISGQLRSPRYSPELVTGACLAESYPAAYDECSKNAVIALAALATTC